MHTTSRSINIIFHPLFERYSKSMKTFKSKNLNGTSLFFQFVQEGNDYIDTLII